MPRPVLTLVARAPRLPDTSAMLRSMIVSGCGLAVILARVPQLF